MTNKERQASLDRQKHIESEKQRYDMSGGMIYCDSCKHRNEIVIPFSIGKMPSSCNVAHSERDSKNLCAVAYNAMKRKK